MRVLAGRVCIWAMHWTIAAEKSSTRSVVVVELVEVVFSFPFALPLPLRLGFGFGSFALACDLPPSAGDRSAS